ncbi:sensor histidine kinase [Haliscomenobacter sp.]|uniref:sensor histidine kinase n=1 Tax=Haliscomenobacter sp. TaxID=2717303 RepID=UPI003BAAB214
MRTNRIKIVIAASCLALLGLIAIQVRWMNYSRVLLDEQFEHRVDMALCNAVQTTAEEPLKSTVGMTCANSKEGCCADAVSESMILSDAQLRKNLDRSLAFYDINLPYNVNVVNPGQKKDNTAKAYSCALDPLVVDDTRRLELSFPTKQSYLLGQMNVMIGSSILILSVILLVFFAASYYLLKQKRLSDQNIDFFNHMAHEFKTPLTNIKLAANLLARKKPELKDDQVLQVIGKESNHLIHQIERFLQMASLEFNKNPLQRHSLDLELLIREVIEDLTPLIREKEAVVELEVKGSLPPMTGDALHLRNAFRNLIDNALKYCEVKPNIQIALEVGKNEQIQVAIRDNGLGICESELSSIFKDFNRGEEATAKRFSGFGLGLAYVKKIVDLHKGVIAVDSTQKQGTCFSMSFPTK